MPRLTARLDPVMARSGQLVFSRSARTAIAAACRPDSPTPFDLAAARVARELVSDLDEFFAGTYPVAVIDRLVQQAIEDLRGSVGVEALPEMAARLARHRLSHAMPAAAS